MSAAASTMPAPARNRHLIFALLVLSLLTVVMQFTMVSVSVKQLTEDLNAPLRWSSWVITIFALGQVIAQPVAGRLTERLGAKSVFAGGLAIFGVASLVCAGAPNVYVMIVARFVQGVAGGGVLPAGSGIIGDVYGENRAKAIGFFASLIPFASVLGPTVGGLIVDTIGWRWTFGINGPLSLVACVLGFALLPRGRRIEGIRVDYAGVLLIAAAATPLIFALTELGRRGVTPNYAIVAGAAATGLAALAILVWHERRTPVPVVDMDLVTRIEFLSANGLMFFFGLCWGSMTLLMPLFLQETYGFSASEAGALLAPRSVAMMASSALFASLLLRTGYRRPLMVGFLSVAALIFLMAQGFEGADIPGLGLNNFWYVMLIVLALGLVFGISNPSMNNAGFEIAPDRIAAITGLRMMAQQLGSLIGIAVAVLIASRADTVSGGLTVAFSVFSVLLALSTVMVFRVPEIRTRSAARYDQLTPAPVPVEADRP
ncbi:MAG: MFS transporter [Dehalococcoidia bacterium]